MFFKMVKETATD